MKTVKNMDSMILYIYIYNFFIHVKVEDPKIYRRMKILKNLDWATWPGDTVLYYRKIKVAQKNLIALD